MEHCQRILIKVDEIGVYRLAVYETKYHVINELISDNTDEYGKLIWGNESYRQSYHYYYTQLTRVDQLSPVLFNESNKSFIPATSYLDVSTLFPIKYYGMQYDSVNILSKGIVGIGKSFRHSGAMKKIEVFNGMDKDGGVEIVNTNKFLAIKWINLSISTLHDDEPEEYAIVACIIYSNGNISVYFEKIPTEFGNNGGKISITDGYDYATYNATGLYIIKTSYSNIKTPKIMIRSGTLVEFAPNTICSEQELCETCIKASTLNEKCYWCPIVNKCSHGFDIHRPLWMLKSCYIKNTTKCQVSTTSVYKQEHGLSSMRTTEYYSNIFPNYSFTNYTKTTPELSTTNSLNSKTTKNGFRTNQLPSFIWDNRNTKSGISLPLYSFILMPTALTVLFLSLICALWLCVYKRSKVCYCLTKEAEFFSVAFYVFRHNPLK
ncbi:unnamed protein product [Schistosoma margrebowiei]|uniref:PSI domain-containing protein n=1 Tax=Schistosoma margrebowiei TaxID=48269 RepID=A0AA85APW3_9TREM|nr:unnamed protein product [Schistosoma margrebowiei]